MLNFLQVLTQLPPKTRQRIPFDVTQSDYKKKIDGIWKELGSFIKDKNYSISNIIKMVQNNTFSNEPDGTEDGQDQPKKKVLILNELETRE